MSKTSYILAIESSCDDTSAAIVKNGKVLNNIVATQSVHEKYGGVVPELASRAHQQHIVPVVSEALSKANITISDLSAIAFTRGPGLLGALLVGVSFSKALSYALNVPLIEVNHMEAHVLAHFIEDPKPKFPFLCLTVSGGHTQIVLVENPLTMKVIGETLDDAVGEAFDKAAKLMGIPYPGGPLIDKYARDGNSERFPFPDTSTQGLNFSFSGVKTALLYFLKNEIKRNPNFIAENLNDICASFQYKLVDMLMRKLKRAVRETGIKQLAIAGGVSANSGLRNTIKELFEPMGCEVFIPKMEYCTDNAAMIGMAAYFKHEEGIHTSLDVSAEPRLAI